MTDDKKPQPSGEQAVDLERVAKSLASMLTEYVEGGIRSNQNWRNGLNEVILARLRRLIAPPAVSCAAREALTDLQTHHVAWRGAIASNCTTFGSDDDGSYWDHELKVFDRVFAALSVLPAAAAEASKREAVHHINGPFASPIKAGTRDLGVCLDCGANDGDDHSDGCSASLRKDG